MCSLLAGIFSPEVFSGGECLRDDGAERRAVGGRCGVLHVGQRSVPEANDRRPVLPWLLACSAALS